VNSRSLNFSSAYPYAHLARQQRGIFLEVTLATDAVITPEIRVSVDSASTYCVFGRQWADRLHLDWEAGDSLTINTAVGTFKARLHEVAVHLLGFVWTAWVAFAEWDTTPPSSARDVLGLTGFFDHFLVGIDDISEIIYLEPRF
jgi:hypothetical protein